MLEKKKDFLHHLKLRHKVKGGCNWEFWAKRSSIAKNFYRCLSKMMGVPHKYEDEGPGEFVSLSGLGTYWHTITDSLHIPQRDKTKVTMVFLCFLITFQWCHVLTDRVWLILRLCGLGHFSYLIQFARNVCSKQHSVKQDPNISW